MVIVNQAERCSICGIASSVMATEMTTHHIQFRSHGGSSKPENLILLCNKCHATCNAEKEGQPAWKIAVTEDYLFVLDNLERVIVKRWFPPPGFDEGLFLQQLEQAPRDLREASIRFRYLSDEALAEVARVLSDITSVTWYCLAQLFREAVMRTPYGDKRGKLEAVAATFDLKRSTAYKYIEALEVIEANEEVHDMDFLPSPDALILIKKASDPGAALTLYVERSVANPNYNTAAFREELGRGVISSLVTPPRYHTVWCEECQRNVPHIRARNPKA